jgi:hypothetical protein
MLPAMMLAASLTSALVPGTAFAQDVQSDVHENEGGDWSVVVDPIVQTSADVDVNVEVNTHVITDPEDCEEANDVESQQTSQGSTQEARSDGNVGDNSVYVSPQVQSTTQVAFNGVYDTDVVPVGCDPSDTVDQGIDQTASQEAGGEVEAGEGSTTIVQTHQRADTIAQNDHINTDVTIPIS